MPEIFISYRREDSSGHAGRILDCMRERFGDQSVFMDVSDIEPGVDFKQALATALASCRVVLVVIGTQWLNSTDSSGRRRLDDPGDHLRLEIVGALALEAHVIPVLVRGAAMPREQDLPDDLRPLARRQAQEVSDSRWSFDTDHLIQIIERDLGLIEQEDGGTHVSRSTSAIHGVAARSRNRSRLRIAVPAAALVVLLGLAAAFKWSAVGKENDGSRSPLSSAAGGRDGDRAPAAPSGARRIDARETPPARLPASGEVRAGSARFKVLGGLVSRDASGSQTVRLYVRTTTVPASGAVVTPGTFRLIVDGEALAPTEAPSVAVAMQSADDNWVAFAVPPNAETAVLQVGDVRQATARIPIDLRAAGLRVNDTPAPTWRYPVDLAARFEKRVGPLLFTVDRVRLDHFGDAVPPLQPEKLEVSFKVKVTNVGAQNGVAVTSQLFRLLVDDVPLAPTKSPSEAVKFQASLDDEVVFLMPGTATNAVLQIGSVTAETAKVPVDLSAAH